MVCVKGDDAWSDTYAACIQVRVELISNGRKDKELVPSRGIFLQERLSQSSGSEAEGVQPQHAQSSIGRHVQYQDSGHSETRYGRDVKNGDVLAEDTVTFFLKRPGEGDHVLDFRSVITTGPGNNDTVVRHAPRDVFQQQGSN